MVVGQVTKEAARAVQLMDQSANEKITLNEFEHFVENVQPQLFIQLGGWNDVFSRYTEPGGVILRD